MLVFQNANRLMHKDKLSRPAVYQQTLGRVQLATCLGTDTFAGRSIATYVPGDDLNAAERGLRALSGYQFVVGSMPPSTRKFAPVMKSASGLDRYAIMFATSPGKPIFPAAKRVCWT